MFVEVDRYSARSTVYICSSLHELNQGACSL